MAATQTDKWAVTRVPSDYKDSVGREDGSSRSLGMTREEEAAAYGPYVDGHCDDEQTLPRQGAGWQVGETDGVKPSNSAENWGNLSPVTFVQKVSEYSERCSGTPKSAGEIELLSAHGEAAAGALLEHLQEEEFNLGQVRSSKSPNTLTS